MMRITELNLSELDFEGTDIRWFRQFELVENSLHKSIRNDVTKAFMRKSRKNEN